MPLKHHHLARLLFRKFLLFSAPIARLVKDVPTVLSREIHLRISLKITAFNLLDPIELFHDDFPLQIRLDLIDVEFKSLKVSLRKYELHPPEREAVVAFPLMVILLKYQLKIGHR